MTSKKITANQAYEILKDMPLKILTKNNAFHYTHKGKDEYCFVGYIASKYNVMVNEVSSLTDWIEKQDAFIENLVMLHVHDIVQEHQNKRIVKNNALEMLKYWDNKPE